jgi:hypothetical protein
MDFSPDGAWRKHTREIRMQRHNLMQSGALRALNASGPSASRITGTFNVPVVLISYSNVAAAFSTASYQGVLFNPAPGRSLQRQDLLRADLAACHHIEWHSIQPCGDCQRRYLLRRRVRRDRAHPERQRRGLPASRLQRHLGSIR